MRHSGSRDIRPCHDLQWPRVTILIAAGVLAVATAVLLDESVAGMKLWDGFRSELSMPFGRIFAARNFGWLIGHGSVGLIDCVRRLAGGVGLGWLSAR